MATALTNDELARHPHEPGDGSWWENDGRGIPLCRVCAECRDVKLSKYRPEILRPYSERDVDEPIDGDGPVNEWDY